MPDITLRFDVPVRTGGGFAGWGPELAVVSDGARRVLQVVDWVGGEGTKPVVGQYVGENGLVNLLIDAVDIRGAAGNDGDPGADGSTVNQSSAVITWINGEFISSWECPATGGASQAFWTTEEPTYITDFAPVSFRITFRQGSEAIGVSLGFQYSGDGISWTDGAYIKLDTDIGVRTLPGELNLPGSGPYYFRPSFKHDEGESGVSTTSPALSLWTLTLTGALTGGDGGGGGSSGPQTTYTASSLRALATHNNNDLAFVRYGTTPGDGVAGPRYYDSSSSAADDGNDVIKPTDVSGSGRWLKVYL